MAEAEAPRFAVGILLFPSVTQLDFTGPLEVLQRVPGATVCLISQHGGRIQTEGCLAVADTDSFEDHASTAFDVFVVPGGSGVDAVLTCPHHCNFVAAAASRSAFVLSVCTGALLLCAARVLTEGMTATTHWASKHILTMFGVITASERVVVSNIRDRSTVIVSSAGVTAGIDGALQVVNLARGEDAMSTIQLTIEYDEDHGGSPSSSSAEVLAAVRAAFTQRVEARERIAQGLIDARTTSPTTV